MSEPTEGPWTVTPDGFRVWSESSAKVVAWCATNAKSRTPEARANARLLAASHDLLRELTHVVRLLEPLDADGRLDVPGLATLNGARAAIAKATEQKS